MIGSLLDTVLDRTVVPGYTTADSRIRRHMWDADDLRSIDGKTVLVSGATSGLGLAAAEGFARLGARVRLLARSEERGERARAAVVEATGNRDVRVCLCCDVSDLHHVRAVAARFTADEPLLDVLVNDAGVLPAERAVSADGNELALATNVLEPLRLTNLLIPLLAASAPARVVIVSSGGMYTRRLDVEDLQSTGEKFDGPTVYADQARAGDPHRFASSPPRFHRVTGPLLRSPEQRADTIVWLGAAAEPGESSGGFWHDRRRRPPRGVPWTRETPEDREELWQERERLTGRHADPVPDPTHAHA